MPINGRRHSSMNLIVFYIPLELQCFVRKARQLVGKDGFKCICDDAFMYSVHGKLGDDAVLLLLGSECLVFSYYFFRAGVVAAFISHEKHRFSLSKQTALLSQ